MLVNNGEQSVLGIINDAKLALVPDDDWTSEMATSKALAAARQAKDDAAPIGHAIAWQAWPCYDFNEDGQWLIADVHARAGSNLRPRGRAPDL